jgi:predicted PurR-regulated permease PerM
MDETMLISILLALVGALFGFLVAILSWMGGKVYNKLAEMASSLHHVENDLRGQLADLDRRIYVVERSCGIDVKDRRHT